MPGAPEDDVEMAPAVNERIEAHRVSMGRGWWGQRRPLAPSPEPHCPRAAACCCCGKLTGSFRVCQNAPRPKGYVLRERAPAEDPKAHIKVGGPRAWEPL